MKRLKGLSKKDKRVYQIVISAVVALCLLVGFLCVQYYIKLQDTMKSENRGYMQEISKQMSTNVNKLIDDKFSVLQTMETVFMNLKVESYEQLQELVEEQRKFWNYENILLIDENGVAYDENGKSVALENDKYLQDVIVSRKNTMSPSQNIDGKESIIFATPVYGLNIEGTKVVALAASYELSTFDQILAMTAFEGKGYAHIIREDGAVVIRSSTKTALKMGYNILNSLSTAQINAGSNVENIKTDIAWGKSGQTEFTLGGKHEYMTYMPLGSQKWTLLLFVPVSVVNAKSNMMLNITLLLCGAVTIAFTLLLVAIFLIFYRNKRRLENIAYVDSVTGGNTIECFYENARKLLNTQGHPKYGIIYTNIEKFKVLNEQFGREACDGVLRSIERGIDKDLASDECMGHLFADNFCVLIKYQEEEMLAERFERWFQNAMDDMEENKTTWLPLILEMGVYVIVDNTMQFSGMIDRAKISLSEAAKEFRGKVRYAIYDEAVRKLLIREKQLEDRMENALEQREFQVYLQPKYRTETEIIGGAEALVRWVSTDEGMIFPDEFIPLFEKNGFIIRLDFYMFEEVCKVLRKWIDAGVEPVKVSVNCSRVHLRNLEFLAKYIELSDKYRIPHGLLEIEITENTVFDDVERLSEIIGKIHDEGFGCSMDDFGSGYSSLNLIQDIPIDTIKLDRAFFLSGTSDFTRRESVVKSIITMSKDLSMETVAEGIEERPQVDMLKRLGCDYIQGYFFGKPMPIEQFEKVAFEKVIEVES